MEKLTVNVSPHVFSPLDTRGMMRGVIKALIPAVLAGVWFFRWHGAGIILSSCLGCLIAEYLIQKLRKKPVKLGDSSALLTGVLLALVLPPAVPLWMAFLGGCVAIGLGKNIFGGLGYNVFNPALLARAFLMAAFPVTLTKWTAPYTLEAITTATPLGLAKFEHIIMPYSELFLGNIGGSLGETSALALIAGIIYLLYTKVIDYRIPLAYIGTVGILSAALHVMAPGEYPAPLFHILAGGLLLGAGFMATDPVTSPVTSRGKWIFGAGCALLTMTIRQWGGLPEGVMYSILLMNAATPLINRFSQPPRFGRVKKDGK